MDKMVKNLFFQYIDNLKKTMDSLNIENFEDTVNTLFEAIKRESQIFLMGNGGSGATASHFACDLNKCLSYGRKKRIKAFCLNDNMPIVSAYSNDVSYDCIFVEQVKNFMKKDDVVLGISGSGNSRNVIEAVEYANEHVAVSIGFSGFDGGVLAKTAQQSIVVNSDDMQIVEDVHLMLTHVIMQILEKLLSLN